MIVSMASHCLGLSPRMEFEWSPETEYFGLVRPKQEMEMKVKNYVPPYAPEPELYLKEGNYTGSNTWSQGEDSGLEESLADSNSQRSHDRATPESLTDDQLVLPKLTDFLDVPSGPDLDDPRGRSSMPPGAMTISMSADDLTSAGAFHRSVRKGEIPLIRPIRADHRFNSTEDVRFRRIKEKTAGLSGIYRDNETVTTDDYRPAARGGSWNRRQKRGASKERGGTQLPTWAETRTTRLRRSKALGETNNNSQQQKHKRTPSNRAEKKSSVHAAPKHQHVDAEDEAEEAEEDDPGKFLMERIRANSRTLKAQVSASHSRRTVADTGTASRERPSREKNGRVHNGVYTMHARRNLRGGAGAFGDEGGAEVETTTIKLLDEHGREISSENVDENRKDESKMEDPEIVHQHTLDVNGEDARNGQNSEAHDRLENISEGGRESTDSNNQSTRESRERNDSILESDNTESANKLTPSERSENDSEEYNLTNDLEEGRLVNQNGKLTIEVEVKEMTNSEDSGDTPDPVTATMESNMTPVPVEDSGAYDSYRVYSEQNLLTPTADQPQEASYSRRSSRADMSRNDIARLNRAKQARGIYLRRMEHINSQTNLARTQSNDRGLENSNRAAGGGGSPLRRYGGNSRSISQNRKSGRSKLEKWSTSAASTGDLREAAWDYSNDKERLLTILNEVRGETRIRQKQREELLRKIKQLQSRAHQRREQGETHSCLRSLPNFARRAESAAVREMWRKRYLEAKKITPRLEEECSRLRQELEKLHRELLAKVQAGVWALLTISGKTERPSNKLSYKIMIARLLQEIEDLTRRVEGTRLKLHTEVKLRSMAEKDVRNLREELLKKKIQVTLTRNQEQAAMGNGLRQQYFISAV
ncbi:uncharacterized protein LOC129971427 isoform X3 [Argiope bruennichi]|uniref:uncharacterized protein LOC129971427 isoform X3 n=1 Tax=Argiope bruennichi TaxID=94029 RepID=UPI002493E7DE|nr:uncharacterized protein LOC129971427 isoform X3 [Argiope bruennichi]